MSKPEKTRTIEVSERVYQYLLFAREYFKLGEAPISDVMEVMGEYASPRDEEFWDYLEGKGQLYRYYPEFKEI